jgi:hypothetical protein
MKRRKTTIELDNKEITLTKKSHERLKNKKKKSSTKKKQALKKSRKDKRHKKSR